MLTAARAWVGPHHVRPRGVVGGCDLLHRHRHNLLGEEIGGGKSLHRQELVMTQARLKGTATPVAAVCKEELEGDAELWSRYSRKRKKQERGTLEAEEVDGSGTETKAGKGDQDGAAMRSPPRLVCSDCGTSRTPLWRKGPAGPKSLCNACGIRYRKAKRAGGPFPNAAAPAHAAPGRDQREDDPHASPHQSVSLKSTAAAEEARDEEGDDGLHRRQKRRQEVLWLLLEESRKFELPCGKEAVEAAVLLMAMSSGLFVRSH